MVMPMLPTITPPEAAYPTVGPPGSPTLTPPESSPTISPPNLRFGKCKRKMYTKSSYSKYTITDDDGNPIENLEESIPEDETIGIVTHNRFKGNIITLTPYLNYRPNNQSR